MDLLQRRGLPAPAGSLGPSGWVEGWGAWRLPHRTASSLRRISFGLIFSGGIRRGSLSRTDAFQPESEGVRRGRAVLSCLDSRRPREGQLKNGHTAPPESERRAPIPAPAHVCAKDLAPGNLKMETVAEPSTGVCMGPGCQSWLGAGSSRQVRTSSSVARGPAGCCCPGPPPPPACLGPGSTLPALTLHQLRRARVAEN